MTTRTLRIRPHDTEADQELFPTVHVFGQHGARFRYWNMPNSREANEPFLIWTGGTSQADDYELLRYLFYSLADQWQQETGGFSLISRRCEHPAYRRIIRMGPQVIPLILRELQRQPDHWFPALRELTGANPVRQEDAGRMNRMAEAWIEWGKTHNYLR